ncbi:uncharacterized protein LOC128734476 isoform X2 [Sabethes cyaneus]|uniref:uncharacterized protein LOC128734476 isoform X2 n=1 Tax=Sabethes cyaneus TaxID=53552 RepID=UPI00237E6A61|nr:uncharacterized protein LOC128734476 isoform X2 [Sabethes cyaneus]
MISAIVSRIVILLFGTLYPAYASYKAVRTKNVKEYVKWMMYWIVFAFFTCIETFTDILLSWFPFYYEIKVILVLWLLSPATRGSSTLYRKFVHPMLTRREQEIDDYINQAKEKGYTAVLQLGSKGVNYATNVIMQTAIKGGGGLVQTLRKSYSLSDLSEPDAQRTQEEMDELTRPQRVLRSKSTRSASGGRHVEMYFPEVELAGTPHRNPPPYNYIRSSDDISSGYSSAEPGLSRTASMSNTARPRVKSKTREAGDDVFYDGRETDQYYSSGSQFPPSATLYEIPPSPLPAITQASVVFAHQPIYSQQSSSSVPSSPQPVPPELERKYEMFLQWMETQKETERDQPALSGHKSNLTATMQESPVPEELEPTIPDMNRSFPGKILIDGKEDFPVEFSKSIPIMEIENEPSEKSFLEDTFRDTISLSSDDEFLEVVPDDDVVPENMEKGIEPAKPTNEQCTAPEVVSEESIPTVVDSLEAVDCSMPLSEKDAQSVLVEDVVYDEKLHISEDEPSGVDTKNIPYIDDLGQLPINPSNLNVSTANLTSSTSSLATSDAGSHLEEHATKKPASHGKRKAPSVPITFKAETFIPSMEAPAAPQIPSRSQKAEPTAKASGSSEPVLEKEKDKKHKPKFMNSLTGMFKHDGPSSSGSSESARKADSLLPKETEI